MASGGYRPGAGRKPGSKNKKTGKAPKKGKEQATPTEKDKIREMLSFSLKAKAKMYQEFLLRVNKGDSLTITEKKMMAELESELLNEVTDEDIKSEAELENLKPLEYMLKVMNDPTVNKDRRDRMAIASAPYLHARKGDGLGKKDELQERAKKAGSGRFAASPSPLKVVKKLNG